jgi:hypothetical protein
MLERHLSQGEQDSLREIVEHAIEKPPCKSKLRDN